MTKKGLRVWTVFILLLSLGILFQNGWEGVKPNYGWIDVTYENGQVVRFQYDSNFDLQPGKVITPASTNNERR